MSVNWQELREARKRFLYLTGENTKQARSISSWCTICGTNTPHTITDGCLCCKEDREAQEYEALNEPERPVAVLKCTMDGCFIVRR